MPPPRTTGAELWIRRRSSPSTSERSHAQRLKGLKILIAATTAAAGSSEILKNQRNSIMKGNRRKKIGDCQIFRACEININ